jgi:hypothetical protein
MYLKISNETLLETTKCLRDFKCLTAEKGDICIAKCRVEISIANKLLFVKKLHDNDCHYNAMSFGYSNICQCPTRQEIYNLYKK